MIIEIYTVDKYDRESKNIREVFVKNFKVNRFNLKVTKLYNIVECEDITSIDLIARDILLDPIVEEYIIRREKPLFKGYKWGLEIFLKKSVADVVGESVSDVINKLIDKKFNVRTGKCFYFSSSRDKFISFIREEFFNDLIHTMEIKELDKNVFIKR
ncbi:MAG: hypothetical protein N2446_02840 [Elusimicrobiales bacterium]|nr:hypothetical protein [Elusimicrobiales bacterium]